MVVVQTRRQKHDAHQERLSSDETVHSNVYLAGPGNVWEMRSDLLQNLLQEDLVNQEFPEAPGMSLLWPQITKREALVL